MLDGAPIAVIVCALKGSRNVKTGDMVQTYIIRSDIDPISAVRSGADASICGDCVHRGDGTGKGRSCYVTLMHGPSSVWRAYQGGRYPTMDPDAAAFFLTGRMLRIGTYGDPAAAPLSLWNALTRYVKGWTGYSHRAAHLGPEWAKIVMASVDNPIERLAVKQKGFRTFRVGGDADYGEILCPASKEAGKKTVCAECRACMGTSGKARVDIYIPPHGSGARYAMERVS